MSVEESSKIKIKCRCCGQKDNYVLPTSFIEKIMGYVTQFDIKYTCHDCAFIEECLNQEG